MPSEHPGRVDTPLGGYAAVYPVDNYLAERIKGPGLMLHLGMQDPTDMRGASIVLSRDNATEVRDLLTQWLQATPPPFPGKKD